MQKKKIKSINVIAIAMLLVATTSTSVFAAS